MISVMVLTIVWKGKRSPISSARITDVARESSAMRFIVAGVEEYFIDKQMA